MKSNDSSKILEILYGISHKAEKQLNYSFGFQSIEEKQRYFINAISLYDKLYLEFMQLTNSKQEIPYYYRIIDYGYPVFIRYFYDERFIAMPGVVLKPANDELVDSLNKLLYTCGIIGWMNSFIDYINSGYMSAKKIGSHIWLRFKPKHHWIEYLEDEYITWYSRQVASFQEIKYSELQKVAPDIIREIEETAFVWNSSFLGYSNSEKADKFFNSMALLDAQQSINWDMFPPDASFGGIKYGDIVQTIVDFTGYTMKHLNYAIVMCGKEKELYLENLLIRISIEDDITNLIASNLNLSVQKAKHILELLQLSANKKSYYNLTMASSAPFIRISSKQYLRSIRGFMDRPFEFMLYSLKKKYVKEWDKNTSSRENEFRTQIYSFFDNKRYICINHPIVIKGTDGKTLTDLDAVIVDRQTMQTAIFQLKWQDPTNDTIFSLRSKAENYLSTTRTWVNQVCHWIQISSDTEIARVLNVKKQYIRNEEIYLFVIGRTHGNYSSKTEVPSVNHVVYGQWYQFIMMITRLMQLGQLSIGTLFQLMAETAPQKKRIIERRTVFKYGHYNIHFGGIAR